MIIKKYIINIIKPVIMIVETSSVSAYAFKYGLPVLILNAFPAEIFDFISS